MTKATPELKASIKLIMERHIGIKNAIHRDILLEKLGLPKTDSADRRMRKAIESIRLDQDGLPIMHSQDGYYLPATEADRQAGLSLMRKRAVSEYRNYKRVQRNSERFLAREHQGSLL